MQITMHIDTATPRDLEFLRAILNVASPSVSEPAGGTEARPHSARISEAVREPAEAPSEPAGGPVDSDLLAEAVKKGTALIKAKKGAKVRAALDDLGVEKITLLDNDDDVRAFLEAIS